MTKEEVVWAVAFGAYCAAQASANEQANEYEFWNAAFAEDAKHVADFAVKKLHDALKA